MIKTALIGVGKMGLSHQAMLNAHPDVDVVAICDSSAYVLGILNKYTGVRTYTNFESMFENERLDAVLIATPTRTHGELVRAAVARGLHIFCEKPFMLSAVEADELAALSRDAGLVTQVGYHNRFVAAFREVKMLLDAGAIGTVTHATGEAFGPVVLKPQGATWRSQRSEGGGCLRDYAAHPIDLLNWYMGEPFAAGGTALNSIFSREIDDEVYATLYYPRDSTAQISANWSDESHRKMTTRITLWGSEGRIFADRQECQAYLRRGDLAPPGYKKGWNVRYTTELTDPVWFYLRGEEYSSQLDHFVQRIHSRALVGTNDFASAAATDRTIALILDDASRGPRTPLDVPGEPGIRGGQQPWDVQVREGARQLRRGVARNPRWRQLKERLASLRRPAT